MAADGYSAATRLDFDLACRALKRWADNREQMTRMVPMSESERNAKPKKAVPVYRTLAEVLALDEDATETALAMSGLTPGEVDAMAEDYFSGFGLDDEDEQ